MEVLQEEVRSQADHIQELHDELEEWQQKCFPAEHQAQELWDELLKSHDQAKETGKAFAQEMEKIKANLANYEDLYNQSLSLEGEVKAGTKETERLRAQLQRVEAENETLRAASSHRASKGQDPEESEGPELISTGTQTEAGLKAQTGECVEAMHEALQDQKRSREMEVKSRMEECAELQAQRQRVEKEKDQLGEEIQSLKALLKEITAREAALQQEIEQQPVQAAQTQSERLTAISKQLEKHASMAKAGFKEYLQELKDLKEGLIGTEKLIGTARLMLLKILRSQEQPSMVKLENPREEETGQQEKNTRMKALAEIDPTRMREEILSTVRECLDQRWGQWVSQYTVEMNCLGKKLGKLTSRYDIGA
ncbi:hypothetical protein Y1Q_0021113 [Alligator mississippiensis]|uniref:Uncharacterized protein n=1 Tax=Alligator mississippiensis TaxID=8496 RepID=A0A151NRI7_ALLMI|nr:hypothetical protein Y1Q_0021113 [Alligator mississippiensis]